MPTLDEIQKQAFDRYHAGQYAEMSDLLTREKDSFPVELRSLYFNWQMCAAALRGHTDQAIAFFQEALDAGDWYPLATLRDDPDLASLQGDPVFEQLVTRSVDQMAEAKANAKADLKLFLPKTASEPFPWLMMLHGNRSNLLPDTLHTFLTHLQPTADRGYLLALPQSSQIHGKDSYVWDDIAQSVDEIQSHAAKMGKMFPIDADNGVLCGYSMGGGLALYMALTGKLAVNAVIVAAPWWQDSAELEAAIAVGNADHLMVAMIVSRHDEACYRVALAVQSAMIARHLTPTLIITDEADHTFPAGFGALVEATLNGLPAKA